MTLETPRRDRDPIMKRSIAITHEISGIRRSIESQVNLLSFGEFSSDTDGFKDELRDMFELASQIEDLENERTQLFK